MKYVSQGETGSHQWWWWFNYHDIVDFNGGNYFMTHNALFISSLYWD